MSTCLGEKMEREEMLEKLKNINVGVKLVALTSEVALECTYVTSEGIGYEWRSLYDWPTCAVIKNVSSELLCTVKEKLASKTLTLSDIEKTSLEQFYFGEKISVGDFFSHVQDVDTLCGNELYALSIDEKVYFYVDYKSFENAFQKNYAICDTYWENMSDEDLEEWINRLENEEWSIPLDEFNGEIE